MILEEPLDWLGFHLSTAVVDDFRPAVFGQVQDVFLGQGGLQELARLGTRLDPADPPGERFAGILVEYQIEE